MQPAPVSFDIQPGMLLRVVGFHRPGDLAKPDHVSVKITQGANVFKLRQDGQRVFEVESTDPDRKIPFDAGMSGGGMFEKNTGALVGLAALVDSNETGSHYYRGYGVPLSVIAETWTKLEEYCRVVRISTEPPPSVQELIRIVELRAAALLRQMEEGRTRALAYFRRNEIGSRKATSSYSAPAQLWAGSGSLGLAAYVSEQPHCLQFASEEQLSHELDTLKHSFVQLHNAHKEELRKGNYAAAHEIVGQIHTEIAKYQSVVALPQSEEHRITIQYLRFDGFFDELMKSYQNYPGLVSKDLASDLPKALSEYCLVDGEGANNRKKVFRWISRGTAPSIGPIDEA